MLISSQGVTKNMSTITDELTPSLIRFDLEYDCFSLLIFFTDNLFNKQL